jgi:hypothetical protein
MGGRGRGRLGRCGNGLRGGREVRSGAGGSRGGSARAVVGEASVGSSSKYQGRGGRGGVEMAGESTMKERRRGGRGRGVAVAVAVAGEEGVPRPVATATGCCENDGGVGGERRRRRRRRARVGRRRARGRRRRARGAVHRSARGGVAEIAGAERWLRPSTWGFGIRTAAHGLNLLSFSARVQQSRARLQQILARLQLPPGLGSQTARTDQVGRAAAGPNQLLLAGPCRPGEAQVMDLLVHHLG